jgi:CubicO group peptidase (beta-lactamase class C family)
MQQEFLHPLGMNASGYDLVRVPAPRRAVGYRREGGTWVEEPAQGAGAFAAMGGLVTSAADYARFVAWLLAAWPPRAEPDDPILRRTSRREIARVQTFAPADESPSRTRGAGYGLGVEVYTDEILGDYLAHAGGLPGYGADVLLLPRHGVAVFAFANLTYGLARRVTYAAATALVTSGAYRSRSANASRALAAMVDTVAEIYRVGDVLAASGALATNLLLDRDAQRRNAEIAGLKRRLGACRAVVSIRAEGALAAVVTFACRHGTLEARIALTPTDAPALAQLEFRQCQSSFIG